MNTKKIIKLSTSLKFGADLVGGKGLNLIKLSQNGFEVPDGFIVSTELFKEARKNIENQLELIVSKVTDLNLGEQSQKISKLINGIKLSSKVEDEILGEFSELGLDLVAVRSSAANEDGQDASWAGQLSTELNVRRENLLDAIKGCWASAYSQRALQYAKLNNLNLNSISVAVVIQKMIQSDISGVAFSVNPITKNQDQILIEAVYGLGEAIVSGAVTPDDYLVDSNSFELIEHQISQQTKKLSLSGDGISWLKVSDKLKDKRKLSLIQIENLARTVKDIERKMGYKADIEWAIKADQLYITQSRPITTLGLDSATPDRVFKESEKLFRWGPTNARYFFIGDFIEDVFKHFGEEMNLTYVVFYDDRMVWVSSEEDFQQFCKNQFNKLISDKKLVENNSKQQIDANKQIDILYRDIDKLKLLSPQHSIEEIESLNQLILNFWLPTLEGEMANYGSEACIKELLAKSKYSQKEILRIMETMCTPEEESFLTTITTKLKAIDPNNLEDFSYEYRWLENGYGGIKILGSNYFKDILKISTNQQIIDIKSSIKLKKQETISKYNLSGQVVEQFDLLTRLIVEQDTRKMYMMKLQEIKFKYLDQLVKLNDKLNNLDVILDYSIGEIIRALKSNQILEPRTNEFGFSNERGRWSYVDSKIAKSVWSHYGSEKTGDYKGKDLNGNTASYGVVSKVKAKARVVEDWQSEEAANFQPGEVLVTTMTTPEYLSLMKKSSAIVTDVGGLTSHAAIVARELGKPCIVGTKAATKIIKTGDELLINTHTGTISIKI